MPIETSKFKKTGFKGKRYKGQKSQIGLVKVLIFLFVLIPLVFYFTSGASRIAFVNFNMGMLYERFGKHESAKKMYESVHVASKGNHHLAQLKYAEMLVNLGETTKADNELTNLMTKNVADDNIMGEVHFLKGRISEMANQFDDAVPSYLRATRNNPDHYDAYIGLGRISRIQGRYRESEQFLENAVSKRKLRAPEAHYELALTYLALGQGARALDHFDYALAQMPSKELRQTIQQKKNETIAGN